LQSRHYTRSRSIIIINKIDQVTGESIEMAAAREGSSTVHVLPPNDQIKELQTILRDKKTSRNDFIFYGDRLIRLVIEEGLNLLMPSSSPHTVMTPLGNQ
jgi:uracil phosphoribosyltransferase